MHKNPIQDVLPPQGRSIRNVPIPSRGRFLSNEKEEKKKDKSFFGGMRWDGDKEIQRAARKKGLSRFMTWLFVLIAIFVLLIAIGNFFSGTTINVIPKSAKVSLDASFQSEKGSQGPDLGHEILSLSRESSLSIKATAEEEVENKASGRITIYNEFSSAPQRLVKNTRFESKDGKIYRIDKSVDVPGRISINTAGSIEVTVMADEPGEKYNIGLTDFTIPGFKSDSTRYSKFYAKSKTEMTGGFVGKMKVVGQEKMISAEAELKKSLEDALLSEATAQLPESFVFYNEMSTVVFDKPVTVAGVGDEVTLKQSGTIYAAIFSNDLLAKAIARKAITNYDGASISIPDIGLLSVKPISKLTDIVEKDTLQFELNGRAVIVWQFDAQKLRLAFLEKNKNDFESIISEFPAIKSGNAVIWPLWVRQFPDNIEKIKIVTKVDY